MRPKLEDSLHKMKLLQFIPQIILLSTLLSGPAYGATCLAPQRPFVPSDPVAAAEYADLIRADFENYIRDVQEYFQCLDQERARAFEEAGEVSQQYGMFVNETRGE